MSRSPLGAVLHFDLFGNAAIYACVTKTRLRLFCFRAFAWLFFSCFVLCQCALAIGWAYLETMSRLDPWEPRGLRTTGSLIAVGILFAPLTLIFLMKIYEDTILRPRRLRQQDLGLSPLIRVSP